MQLANFLSPPSLAIANNATTPVPPAGVGALAWSTTTATLVRWSGTNWQAILAPLTASATSIQSIATTADLTGTTLTIPANYLVAGATYLCKMYGTATVTTTASTLTAWFKLNSTKETSLAQALGTTAGGPYGWQAEFVITVYTVGSSGTMFSAGYAVFALPTVSVLVSTASSTYTINTTTSNTFSIGSAQTGTDTIYITSAFITQMI